MSEERIALTGTIEIARLSFSGDPAARRLLDGLAGSPAIPVVHELAWDLLVEQVSTEGIEAAPSSTWPGVRITYANGHSLWPVPSFATFTEIACLYDNWNQIFRLARERSASENGQDLVDLVARAFIERIVDVSLGMQRPRRDRLDPGSVGSWAHIAVRIEHAALGPRRDRTRAFEAWRSSWRVFAAPELGLSEKSAATILGTEQLEPDREVLQRARRELCEAAGIEPDNSSKDHPWLHIVERPVKPPKRRPKGK